MRIVALDTETALIAPGLLAPPLACVSYPDGIYHHTDLDGIRSLFDNDYIVGANIAYDMAVLLEAYPTELGTLIFDAYRDKRVIDVQLTEKLIWIARGSPGQFKRSLDYLHQKYGYEELDKNTWRLKYGELRDLPLSEWPEGAIKYAVDDAIATMRVCEAQHAQYEHYLDDECNQPGPAFALHLQSCWGIITDAEEVARVMASTEEAIALAEHMCIEHGLVVKGKRKKKPAQERLQARFKSLGMDIPLTPKGMKELGAYEHPDPPLEYVQVGEDACEQSGDDALKAYATLGSAKTLRKKVETLAHGSHTPLQTRYDSLLNTGRTSSSAPGAPLLGDNFQNMARSGVTRKCVIPSPGHLMWSIDFGMMELVCWAQVCLWELGFSRMAEVLNAGIDPHSDFAAKYLHPEKLTYDEFRLRLKQGDKECKHYRQCAKGYNFGAPGGLAKRKLQKYLAAMGVFITLDEAQRILNAGEKQWPELGPWFAAAREACGPPAYCGTVVQHVSGRVRGYAPYCAWLNSKFQGLAADAAKEGLLPIQRECYLPSDSPLWGSRLLLFAHDENIGESPEEVASEAAFRARDIMLESARKYVPDVLLTAEPCLMRRWYKEAEAVYDESGRLVPWEPSS